MEINDMLTEAAAALLSTASAQRFDPPYRITITDSDGEVLVLSDYIGSFRRVVMTSESHRDKLRYPIRLVLTDRAGVTLRSEIQQPERTQ
jgi:hypothetical protein